MASAQKPQSSTSPPKKRPSSASGVHRPHIPYRDPRDGLGEYLSNPEHALVLYANDFAVVINDLYPKAFMHALLIPRSEEKRFMHPFDAFSDQEFLAKTKEHVQELKQLVANELRNRLGQFSATEQPRRAAMDAAAAESLLPAQVTVPKSEHLPPGRNWEAELLVGVHAGPSMNHLHIHVLSPDHYSQRMKHRKHYNSFATPFLVRLEEFPLARDDPRRRPDRGGWLSRDLTCWRCGRNFKTRFEKLKVHLEKEFEEWKRL